MVELIQYILPSVEYVSGAPHFWASMGFIVSVAMLVSVMLYNGTISILKKGVYSVLLYALLLFWVNGSRVFYYLAENPITTKEHGAQALGNSVTLVVVTLFWLFGILLGRVWYAFIHRHHKRKGVLPLP